MLFRSSIFLIAIFIIPFIGFLLQKAIYPAMFIAISLLAINIFFNSLDIEYSSTGEKRLLIVQGNVPRSGLMFNEQKLAVLENHVKETQIYFANNKDDNKIDAILWPENSIDVDPYINSEAKSTLNNLLKKIDIPLIAGAVLTQDDNLKNSIIQLNDDIGDKENEYTKIHLVPFGEYLPFRNLLESRISRLNLLSKDFIRGNQITNFQIGEDLISPIIC